jgi:hypothetical protein
VAGILHWQIKCPGKFEECPKIKMIKHGKDTRKRVSLERKKQSEQPTEETQRPTSLAKTQQPKCVKNQN